MKGKNLGDQVGFVKDWVWELRGKKYSTTARFLRRVVEEYASFNAESHLSTGCYDFPLCYGEWENQPILWYSMRRVHGYTVLPLAEQAYERRLRGEARKNKKQRLDYLVLLKDNVAETVLWIEYKHRIAYLNRRERFQELKHHSLNGLDAIGREWSDDKAKLARMYPSRYKDLWSFSKSSRKPVKVNLLIMPICQRICQTAKAKTKEGFETVNPEDLFSWVSRVRKKLEKGKKPCINWAAAWSLHPDLRKHILWKDDKGKEWRDYYYGVLFFAYLWSD